MRCRAAETGAVATASLIEEPSLAPYRRIARPVCLPGRLARGYARTVPVWSAEVELDEGLVRRLIGQFPELPVRSLRMLAEGWDNTVWLANERYAFRFPRRRIAI